MKNKEFTNAELKKIERLASQYSFAEIAKELKISENIFLQLRQNNAKLKKAVERGVLKRDKTFTDKQIKKRAKAITQGNTQKMPQSKYHEIDERDALKKFREKFEADKRRASFKELRDIDIL